MNSGIQGAPSLDIRELYEPSLMFHLGSDHTTATCVDCQTCTDPVLPECMKCFFDYAEAEANNSTGSAPALTPMVESMGTFLDGLEADEASSLLERGTDYFNDE